ncbi:MAG: ATP-binding protein [Chthoniobacteraceae bacterium]
MTDFEQWQQSNAHQLGEALARLRARLEGSIPQPPATASPAPTKPESATPLAGKTVSRSVLERMFGGGAAPKNPPPADNADAAAPPQPPAAEPPSAHTILAQRLGLSDFEKDVLLLCAAMELDTRIPALCARAQDDPNKPFPTFALALAIFDNPSWDIVSPERPLRIFRLIEISQAGAQPLTASPLRADERIVNYIKGLNHFDDRLAAYCTPAGIAPAAEDLAPSQAEVAETIAGRLQQNAESALPPVVQLLGPDPEARLLVAQAAAARLGLRLQRIPADLLPAQPAELETLARLWQRESMLLPHALFLDAHELDGAAADRFEPLGRFLARTGGLVFIGIREPFTRGGVRSALHFDVAKPTPAEQQAAWVAALGPGAAQGPERLAGQFDLHLASIRRIAQAANVESASTPEAANEKAWELCCASERPRLDALAQRLVPKVTRDDLVLPDAEMDLLDQIAAQVRQRRKVYGEWGFARNKSRGLGISALFAGASGTGKTMAAEVLANELRLNLYRIDLSAVVSKYIGETEKNLRRLFDAGESGGAILFFDEADALFGKRSEVKDSHDRYANIEINYLLQRIESYRGLAILATNMKSALDGAFLRRLRFIVNFPIPGADERRKMWEKVFPADDAKNNLRGVPTDALDFDRLAKLNLTGGLIDNVALNAAFHAAEQGSRVTMPLVLEAARAEFQKLQRPINAADFHWPAANGKPSAQAAAQPA